MIFYPKTYLDKITDINLKFLKENNIKGILIDIDNTLITCDNIVIDNLEEWANMLKNNKIKVCILSNTNKKEKAKEMAKILNAEYYIYFAKKPLKFGFNKAKKILNLPSENIAVVGDQVLTDILGANRSNMYSILVKPLKEKDIFITRFNRIIERKILKKYFQEEKTKANKKEE